MAFVYSINLLGLGSIEQCQYNVHIVLQKTMRSSIIPLYPKHFLRSVSGEIGPWALSHKLSPQSVTCDNMDCVTIRYYLHLIRLRTILSVTHLLMRYYLCIVRLLPEPFTLMLTFYGSTFVYILIYADYDTWLQSATVVVLRYILTKLLVGYSY